MQTLGQNGKPGMPGNGMQGGKQGYGGCGESTWENDRAFEWTTKCRSYPCCVNELGGCEEQGWALGIRFNRVRSGDQCRKKGRETGGSSRDGTAGRIFLSAGDTPDVRDEPEHLIHICPKISETPESFNRKFYGYPVVTPGNVMVHEWPDEGNTLGVPGKSCPKNIDGINGKNGREGIAPGPGDISQIIDRQWILDIPYVLQDMLLKYAIGLQNSDQSSEAQEIYIFLQKVQNVQIRKTAEKLLTNMSKNGEMKPKNEIVDKRSFNEINNKLEKYLEIGIKVENALNFMGQKFSFRVMMEDVADTALGMSHNLCFYYFFDNFKMTGNGIMSPPLVKLSIFL